jgi:hypothetical protein
VGAFTPLSTESVADFPIYIFVWQSCGQQYTSCSLSAPDPLVRLPLPAMACCCTVTSEGTVKLIESCGKFSRVNRPGLGLLIPCVENVGKELSMRLQQMEITCTTKSKDNVFLTIQVAVQFQVIDESEKMQAAYYKLTNPGQQVCVHPHS